MEEKKIARVVEILLDKYVLKIDNEYIYASARGNIKKKNNIIVGDMVECVKSYDKYMIEKILPRKNQIIRPAVANIDQLVIVLSIKDPVPDFMLLDKQLVLCKSKNISPVICVNKIDLSNDFKEIEKVYKSLDIPIIYVSAKEGKSIDKIKEVLKGKVSAFSGNSGVGKSSITKKLLSDEEILIGDISSKTSKGKHTTKYVKLYELDEDTYILDTPGFSSYELFDISHKELKDYYPEFVDCICDYDDCNHVFEKDDVCDVKRKVKSGKIDINRYERYVYLFNLLKEKYDKKYK